MISLSVNNTSVLAALTELKKRLDNLEPALDSIGSALVTEVAFEFKGEHDPWGGKWRKLSPSTIARRRKGSDKILRDTGIMANSFTHDHSHNRLLVGTSTEYAKFHQFGTKHIPSRPMLPIQNDEVSLPVSWLEVIMNELSQHLEG